MNVTARRHAVVLGLLLASITLVVACSPGGSPSPAPPDAGGSAAATPGAPDSGPPEVTVTAPRPDGSLEASAGMLEGTATDDSGVAAVFVQVRDEATQRWLRPDGTWGAGARRIGADLAEPGATSTGWSFALSLPSGSYGFDVVARDAAGTLSDQPWTAFAVGGAPVQGPSRVVLTPTTTPSTSQAVSWRAAEAETKAYAQVQPAAGGRPTTVPAEAVGTLDGDPRQNFTATFTGLTAATDYRYRVGSAAAGWSPWSTVTTAGTEPDFSFLYFGDAQVGIDTTWPRVVDAAMARAPQAAGSVHTGDLVNDAGIEEEWTDWFDGMAVSAATTNVLAAPGNHEYIADAALRTWKASFEYPRNSPDRGSVGGLARLAQGTSPVARQHAAYFDHWARVAPETIYLTDYEGVRFVALNPTRDMTFLEPPDLPDCADPACPSSSPGDLWIRWQAAWLDGVLARSPATWNVVAFHQPVFSAAVGRDETSVRQHLLPVIEEHAVDLVLMGHDHVYSRGHLDDDATSTPGLTSGPVFVVANAGAQHFELETDPERNIWTRHGATQVTRAQGVSSYQVVDVAADTLRYRSYLVETDDDTDTTVAPGDLLDEFTVTRGDDGRRWVTEPGVTPPG